MKDEIGHVIGGCGLCWSSIVTVASNDLLYLYSYSLINIKEQHLNKLSQRNHRHVGRPTFIQK